MPVPMATTSGKGQRTPFFPKADAAILSARHGPLPTYPKAVAPVYDPNNFSKPIGPWPANVEEDFYPPPKDDFAPASVPEKPAACLSDRYLRAFLAENERLRCCMLWYYTRDLLDETEFLSGLQEKTSLAQESTGWVCGHRHPRRQLLHSPSLDRPASGHPSARRDDMCPYCHSAAWCMYHPHPCEMFRRLIPRRVCSCCQT